MRIWTEISYLNQNTTNPNLDSLKSSSPNAQTWVLVGQIMGKTRGIYASIVLIMLISPLVSSSISDDSIQRGGLDFNGDWVASVEPEIHFEWWLDWSRDKDGNSIDDRLEWLILQPSEIQQQWWKRASPGSARVFIDYDHPVSYTHLRAHET